MSLAPASSRGAFLKARLAVNGIQCAARSLGTLTAAGRGLLSSMGASSSFGAWLLSRKLSASARDWNARRWTISGQSGGFGTHCRRWLGSQIGGADPEHFAFRILGVEPEEIDFRIGRFERGPAAADLAQQPAFGRQMPPGLVKNAADDVEAVGSAIEGKLRLGAAFARQSGHANPIDIGRVGDDQVVALVADRPEQVAAVQHHPFLKAEAGNVAGGDVERILGDVDRVDRRVRKAPARQNGKTAGAGAEVEHVFDPSGIVDQADGPFIVLTEMRIQ